MKIRGSSESELEPREGPVESNEDAQHSEDAQDPHIRHIFLHVEGIPDPPPHPVLSYHQQRLGYDCYRDSI